MKSISMVKGVFLFLFMMIAVLVTNVDACAAVPTWEELSKSEESYNGTCFVGNEKVTRIFKKYDVTGDKKKDTVKIVYTPKGNTTDYELVEGQLKIYVNGKCAFKQLRDERPEWVIQLIRLKNGKVFFYIESCEGSWNAQMIGLYQYQSGKLKQVYDLIPFHAAAYEILDVKENKIVFRKTGTYQLTGMICNKMTFVYKKGKLRLASGPMKCYGRMERGEFDNTWTATHTMKVYKKVGSKKVAFKIKKDSKITIKSVIYKKGEFYFQVKELTGKKRTGYMPEADSDIYDDGSGWRPHHFNECQFVG